MIGYRKCIVFLGKINQAKKNEGDASSIIMNEKWCCCHISWEIRLRRTARLLKYINPRQFHFGLFAIEELNFLMWI